MLCRSFFVFLAMTPIVSLAGGVEHHFVRIFEPQESDKYATTISNVAGDGYFYFLDKQWRPDDLRIRVRMYRPVDGDFELVQEQDAEVRQSLPGEPATLQFLVNMKPAKRPKAGKYLYRVDCFDKTGKEEKLLASNSVILTFVGVRKNNEPGVQASKPRRSNRVSRIISRSR